MWASARVIAIALLTLAFLAASPSQLSAQGVAFIATANLVQPCTADAIQPLGAAVLGVSAAGTVVANSSINLTFIGNEISGTPVVNGTGAGTITVTMTGNTVILRFTASVNYVPGNFLSLSGVLMQTNGLAVGANVPVLFAASSAAPTTNPITFTAAQRPVAIMISCDMAIDSGNEQVSTVDTLLPTPLAILFSPCKPGTPVIFSVASGGGLVSPATATVDALCKASTTLRLGQKMGINTVSVRSAFSSTVLSFRALGNPAAAANMSILSGNNQTGTVGQPLELPLVIKVVDQFDNPVPRVSFVLDVIEGGGLLSFFTGQTETEGLFSTNMRLGNSPGVNRVRATTPHLPDRELFFTATAVPVVATTLLLNSGNNQTGVPGQPIQPFVVRITGSGGIPIGGATVQFAVVAGGGSLSLLEATADATGIASTVLTLGPQQGVNTVRATSGTLTGSPLTFNALGTTTGQAPVLFTGGVVNGASFRPAGSAGGNVAPGSIVALFGSELAQAEAAAQSTPLPTILGDTTVTFNGIAAPLFFVSPGQINAQVPWGLPAGEVAVRLRRGFLELPSQSIQVSAVSPGIFTVTRDGSGIGAILHADTFQPVTENARTAPGRRIAVFMTGLGPVNPPAVSGQPAPTPAPATVSSLLANIAGTPTAIEFSGLAPGFVGLYQVNLVVPAGTPSGNQELQVIINGVTSNTVTLPVQ